jgi:cell division protein FtsW
VVLALLAWGLVMVYSASVALPDNPKFTRYYAHLLPDAAPVLAIGIGLVVCAGGGAGARSPSGNACPLVFLLALCCW